MIKMLLGIWLVHSLVHAENATLCSEELTPFYKAEKAFDGSEKTRKVLLKKYHQHREAVYSVCTAEKIREFEAAYRNKIGKDTETKLESMNYYPRPRKTQDLGEFEKRYPASWLWEKQKRQLKEK